MALSRADRALALDWTLGILTEPLLGVAKARLREDASFRRLVEEIEARLFQEDSKDPQVVEVQPRPETWDAILAEIAKREAP